MSGALPLTPAEPAAKYSPLEHMVQLDAIRAIAALMVLFGHFAHDVRHYVEVHHMGVRLFYVLSGFLITGILLRCRDLADSGARTTWQVMKQFYARRFLRIFPLFYFTLALYFFGSLLMYKLMPENATAQKEYHDAQGNIFWLVTYLANFRMAWTGESMGNVAAYWSLAVEEQFYIVWPWMIMLAPRKWLKGMILGTIAVGLCWRIGVVGVQLALRGEVYNWRAATMPTFGCLDTLGMGALLAYVSQKGADPKWRARLITIGFWVGGSLMVLMQAKHSLFYHLWHFGRESEADPLKLVLHDFAQALFYAWVVATAARGFQNASADKLMERVAGLWGGLRTAARATCGAVAAMLSLRWLRYVGTISYGVYVYHNFLWFIPHDALNAWLAPKLGGMFAGGTPAAEAWLSHWFGQESWGLFLPRIVLTVLVAMISWHLFEKPLNDLKKHFEYDKKKREAQGQPTLAGAPAN